MAILCERHFQTFEDYHHTFVIEMTDLHEGSDLQFIGDYLQYGKRFDHNQPGVTGQTLDQTHDGNKSIFHYFCNRTKAPTGVSGGMMYKYNGIYLYIGFNNPLIGFRESFAELKQKRETAKWAYEQLENRDYKTSTCKGWRVEAAFEQTRMPKLKVKVCKDDGSH